MIFTEKEDIENTLQGREMNSEFKIKYNHQYVPGEINPIWNCVVTVYFKENDTVGMYISTRAETKEESFNLLKDVIVRSLDEANKNATINDMVLKWLMY